MTLRRLLLPAVLLMTAAGASPAFAGGVPATEWPPTLPAPAAADLDVNPCHDPELRLRCPNLVMAPPSNMRAKRVGKVVRLLAENRIVNTGAGPLEVRATHTSGHYAAAEQVVRTEGGGAIRFPEAGFVYFKAIPGQGHYWKFWRAARFELWTLNADGSRNRMVRTGPKLSYCFRDLERVRTFAGTPRGRVYGACSQREGKRELKLGTSRGWADIYPATYHENWISVTGLRGCYAFVHRADPLDALIEEREDDNLGIRNIRLPARKNGSVAGC